MSDECDETITDLYRYLDGELTIEVRERIRIHLDDCPPCGDVAVFEAELRRVVASKCHERVPDDLRARIMDACRENPAPADS